MISVADMVDHIESLCRSQQGIDIRWCQRSNQSFALRECEEITIAPIKSVVTYAVALHEIGHVRGRYQDSRHCMVRERWAWDWAKHNAIVWTPRMAQCAAASLQWYANGYGEIAEVSNLLAAFSRKLAKQ